MNRTLKALAISAGMLFACAPAFAQAQPPAAPTATTLAAPPAVTSSDTATPDASSYDATKAQFKQLVDTFTNALDSAKFKKLTGDLQDNVTTLGKLDQEYRTLHKQPVANKAKLDAIVQKYSDTVQSIEVSVMTLSKLEQQIGTAANAGITALAQSDPTRAESDKDIESMVASLQKAVSEKIDAPLSKAAPAVSALSQSVQRAVQARLKEFAQEETKRAIRNHLESEAAN